MKGGERPAWPSPRKRFECRPKSLSSMSVEVLVSWSCVASRWASHVRGLFVDSVAARLAEEVDGATC